ncbi:MAG: DEAD/DEAH box helicase, partial [Candidatus Bathyarchaeota archaeon]|nr:DEAD/DEAH box helicase [Candidatus Bathyarchaeota archaeon]
MTFEDLNIIDPVLKALRKEEYSTPTPVQAKAIPLILNRKDILG